MSKLKDLGKRLAALLEEDAWNHIEPLLNDAEAENEALKQQVEQGKRDAERWKKVDQAVNRGCYAFWYWDTDRDSWHQADLNQLVGIAAAPKQEK